MLETARGRPGGPPRYFLESGPRPWSGIASSPGSQRRSA